MAEEKLSLTASQLKDIIETAVRAASAPNALEQKRLDEELDREKRRSILSVQLGKIEEEARWRKQNSCSHSCNDKTGESVPRGTGRWTTGGQIHGNGVATLICQRCATTWQFTPSHQEAEYINNGPGLLGYAPPPLERCLNRDDFATRPPASMAVSQ
jgi:hypothetical protein